MKKLILLILIELFCSKIFADKRAENVFSINGKTVEITHKMLETFRSSWEKPTPVIKTVLEKNDARWALDYISIQETIILSRGCDKLNFHNVRKFEIKIDDYQNNFVKEAGLFDEVWIISACGNKHHFRIVQHKNSNEFNIYAIKL